MYEIYFSQIREDSRVERHLQNQWPLERIVCIGSGGCTAFSLLGDDVHNVYTVDVNRAQCALIELKRAAIRALDLDTYLGFVGERPMAERIEVFETLKGDIPLYARRFWNHHRVKITLGINRAGVTERFYKLVGDNLRNSVCGEDAVRDLLSSTSMEEQRQRFERVFASDAWKLGIRLLMSKTTQLSFYPSFWFAETGEDDFGEFFCDQFDREVQTKLVSNNYFLSQLFFGSYIYDQLEGTPHYLSPEGFQAAKRNLHKLTVVNEALQSWLARQSGIDAFFLSNVFDWGREADRFQVCDAVIKAKSDEALFLYRNMYGAVSLSERFTSRFEPDEVLSEQLHQMERSMLYRKVTTGVVR